MQPKPIKPSIRKQKRAKRMQGRNDLKLLVESFTSTEERRHQISSALKISQDTWRSYALRNRDLFLKVHSKMKTLGFAISVLKIREFNTLKTCIKNGYQKKVFRNCFHFSRSQEVHRLLESGVSESALGALAASAIFHWQCFLLKEAAKEEVSTAIRGYYVVLPPFIIFSRNRRGR